MSIFCKQNPPPSDCVPKKAVIHFFVFVKFVHDPEECFRLVQVVDQVPMFPVFHCYLLYRYRSTYRLLFLVPSFNILLLDYYVTS